MVSILSWLLWLLFGEFSTQAICVDKLAKKDRTFFLGINRLLSSTLSNLHIYSLWLWLVFFNYCTILSLSKNTM